MSSGEPRLLGVFLNVEVSPRDHVLVFECDVVSISQEEVLTLEIAEIRFFEFGALPDEFGLSSEHRLDGSINRLRPCEFW